MYVIAHDIQSLFAGSVIKGGATGYISSPMLTEGGSSLTNKLSKGAIFSVTWLSMTSN